MKQKNLPSRPHSQLSSENDSPSRPSSDQELENQAVQLPPAIDQPAEQFYHEDQVPPPPPRPPLQYHPIGKTDDSLTIGGQVLTGISPKMMNLMKKFQTVGEALEEEQLLQRHQISQNLFVEFLKLKVLTKLL